MEINDSRTEILFLTNLNDPSEIEIANSYKLRWYIEVFLKFLKQHLQFKSSKATINSQAIVKWSAKWQLWAH